MACNIVEETDIINKYSCGICQCVLSEACRPDKCQHVFCKDCLYNWYNQKQVCPMCIRQFDFSSIVMQKKLQDEISRLMTYCDQCDELIHIKDMQTHRGKCANNTSLRVQTPSSYSASANKSTLNSTNPITSSKLTPGSAGNQATGYSWQAASGTQFSGKMANRYTFKCPYCHAANFDADSLRDHCNQNHKNDNKNMVCPICTAMPWGDPNYKSIDFITHLNFRHKFEYDKYVDFKLNDDEALSEALQRSLKVY